MKTRSYFKVVWKDNAFADIYRNDNNELLTTLELAIEAKKEIYAPTPTMSKENEAYWLQHSNNAMIIEVVEITNDVTPLTINSQTRWTDDFIDGNPEEKTDNGLTAEDVKEYYLNIGNPDYNEEPFASEYSDLDWIEYANENDLKR